VVAEALADVFCCVASATVLVLSIGALVVDVVGGRLCSQFRTDECHGCANSLDYAGEHMFDPGMASGSEVAPLFMHRTSVLGREHRVMRVKDEHPAKGWAAGYGRVSLATPHLNQDSPENHVRVNRQTAARSGLKIKPGYEFYDRGITGSKDVRLPELERAIRAVVEREVEALIVPAFDRLSRRGMRHIGEMLDAVEAAGGRIIFGKEGLDSGSSGSRATIVFLAEQARAEAQALSWRLATWQEGCRLKGKWTGKCPYGYLVVDGRLVHHPDEAAIVRRIVAAFLSGQGCRQIASMLNDEGVLSPNTAKAEEIRARGRQPKNQPTTWGLSTVSELLRNPVLAGWRQHRGSVVLGPDGEPVSFGDGILQPDERIRILTERDRRTTIIKESPLAGWIGRTTGGCRPPRYLLAGLATCETCGYSMVGHNRPERGHVVYRCSTFINGYTCKARAHIRSELADEEVRRQLSAASRRSSQPTRSLTPSRSGDATSPTQATRAGALSCRVGRQRHEIGWSILRKPGTYAASSPRPTRWPVGNGCWDA
jgi:DNA invertase Pin-like site-specific DNA recombinase